MLLCALSQFLRNGLLDSDLRSHITAANRDFEVVLVVELFAFARLVLRHSDLVVVVELFRMFALF